MTWSKRALKARPESPRADRGEALARSQLAALVVETIRERQLNQHLAACLMDLDQPKVSHLLTGHVGEFSIERLIRFLTALGRDVEIVVGPRVWGRRRGRLRADVSS
jgi:predicted XRE-type DNA-binding protein